jgi:excisionase family DNA binding protein
MTIAEACRRLGIGSSEYVRRCCVTGRIRATKDANGHCQIGEAAIEAYLSDRQKRHENACRRDRDRMVRQARQREQFNARQRREAEFQKLIAAARGGA